MTEQQTFKRTNLLSCSRTAYKSSDLFTFAKYIQKAGKRQLILGCIWLPDCGLAKGQRSNTVFRVHMNGLFHGSMGRLCQGPWGGSFTAGVGNSLWHDRADRRSWTSLFLWAIPCLKNRPVCQCSFIAGSEAQHNNFSILQQRLI